jgi:hypothetical protein
VAILAFVKTLAVRLAILDDMLAIFRAVELNLFSVFHLLPPEAASAYRAGVNIGGGSVQ